MADEKHFMNDLKGPAKQFLVLVGDDDGKVRNLLDQVSKPIEDEVDCYFIDNYYYSAKYGLKTFSTLLELKQDQEKHNYAVLCIFAVYKSMTELAEAVAVAEKTDADMKVMIIESLESCPEAEKVEEFASGNGFETVYLTPNEQQLIDAHQLAEKVGIDRLVETLQVCNWPWRVANGWPKFQSNALSFLIDDDHDRQEQNMGRDDIMGASAAEALMQEYIEWQNNRNAHDPIPAPQHAERVHLSPDSPTTTEGTTNHDDVSISVDIDLVCSKTNEEQRSEEDSQKADKTPKKKKVKTN